MIKVPVSDENASNTTISLPLLNNLREVFWIVCGRVDDHCSSTLISQDNGIGARSRQKRRIWRKNNAVGVCSVECGFGHLFFQQSQPFLYRFVSRLPRMGSGQVHLVDLPL